MHHPPHVWNQPVLVASKPVAVHRQFVEGFRATSFAHWEIIFSDTSRTELLSTSGESTFAKLQFEKTYSRWIKEQEELWEGPIPPEGEYWKKENYNTYLRNLYEQEERKAPRVRKEIEQNKDCPKW